MLHSLPLLPLFSPRLTGLQQPMLLGTSTLQAAGNMIYCHDLVSQASYSAHGHIDWQYAVQVCSSGEPSVVRFAQWSSYQQHAERGSWIL